MEKTVSNTSNNSDRSTFVQSIERGLVLIDTLSKSTNGLTLTELCELVGLHPSTAYRILSTLVQHEYIRQDERSKVYRLGYNILRLGQAAQDQIDLRDEFIYDLEDLAQQTQELANVVILTSYRATYIAQINGRKGYEGVQMFTQLGATVPLYCTAVGKSILAQLSEEKLGVILAKESMTSYTPYTITTLDQLREELEEVRRNGYAIDNEEREIGVRCVASSILDGKGQVIAAIGISGPSGRISIEKIPLYAKMIMEVSHRISNRMGYRGEF